MKKLLLLPLLVFTGCSMVKELKAPPYPYTVIAHSRVIGVEASIPNQAGDSVFKFRLGIVTQTLQLIPCSTNKLFIPSISDDFVFGQTFSLSPDTSVKESLQTGWSGDVPPPLRLNLFPEPNKP
jgi:hypothetical protein